VIHLAGYERFGWDEAAVAARLAGIGQTLTDVFESAERDGITDGMKVDKDGNLFASGPGGLHVFAPDGTHLGTISPDSRDPISNCAWGDDGSTLYMTVNHHIARIKTNTKGAGW
jgi:gluconolactonase